MMMSIIKIVLQSMRLIFIKFRKLRINLSGRPISDLSYKQQCLLETGWRFGCSTFVETGTYLGDTVNVMKFYFDRVLSVELSEELHKRNRERFKNFRNIILWCGSSSKLMPEILRYAGDGRILFWLDAHYSGQGTAGEMQECPIMSELAAIGRENRNDHCILIDDAGCFSDKNAYPSINDVKEALLQINPSFSIIIEHDRIIALPTH
jgi:hypothetical protein